MSNPFDMKAQSVNDAMLRDAFNTDPNGDPDKARLAAFTIVKNRFGFESVSGREFDPNDNALEPAVYLTKVKKAVEAGSVESLWSQDYRDFKAIPAEDLQARVKYIREKSPDKFREKAGEAVSSTLTQGLTADEMALLPDIDDDGLGANATLSQWQANLKSSSPLPSSNPRLNAVGGARNPGGEAGARMSGALAQSSGYKRMGKLGDSWLPKNDFLSDDEVEEKRKTLGKWRQLARDRKDVQDYESELMRQNAWAAVMQAKKSIGSTLGQEVMDYALDHKGKLDTERLEKFQGMDNDDKRKMLPMLSMLKEASDGRSWAGDTARAFMRSAIDTPMKAGQFIFNSGVMAYTQDDELYQTMIESQALLEMANEPEMKDWGFLGNAVIGVASTIPYAGYAASGLGTAAIVMSTANDFEQRIAAEGGDVTSPEVFFGKVAAGVAYVAVERAQFSKIFAPVEKMGTRQAFLKMFSSVNSALRVGGVVLGNTTAETLEESVQQGVEEGFVAMGLGRDVAASAASGAVGEFADSLGTMTLMSMGGAAKQRSRYKQGVFNSREELVSTELLGLNLATKFATGDFGKQDVAQFGNELGMLFKVWMSTGGNDAEFAAQFKFDSGTARSLGNSFRSVYSSIGGNADYLKTATGGQHVLDLGEQMSTAMPWLEVKKNDDGSYHVGRKAGAEEGTPNVDLRVELRPGSEFEISDETMMDDAFQNSIVEALRDHPSGVTLEGFRGMPVEERRKLVNEVGLTSNGYYVAADQAGNEVTEEGVEAMIPAQVVSGKIVLNSSILPTAQFHEMFHAVAAMMRDSGMMNEEMSSGLRALFGDPVAATEAFNEERAADAYRDYVVGKVDPVSKSYFDRFADYVGNLVNVFRALRHRDDTDTDRFTQFVEAVRTGNFREVPTVLAKASAEQKPVAPVNENVNTPVADESSLSSAPVNTGALPAAPVKQEAAEQGRWTAVTPDGSMRVEGDLVFMPLDELIDSDDPRYTKEFQGRARDTVSSQLQIERMSDNIDETRLMDSATTDQGPPTVTADAMIISGNGRVKALRKARQKGKLVKYEAFVRAKAAEMGVDLSGVNPPVLVRRLRSDMSFEDLVRLAELSNRPSILQRSAVEQAEADATTLVSSELLELMETGESGDLSLASNRTFMNSFIERTGDQSLRLSDGAPSPEAYARVRRAALAAVFTGTPNYRDFLRLVFERGSSEDGIGVKREIDGITRAAPQLVRLARRNPDYALNTQLALAFSRYMDFRNTGGNPEAVEAFIAQGDMFAERDMLSDGILRQIGLRHSSVLIGDLLQDYANRAMSIDPAPDMFGTPALTPQELFEHSSEATMPVDLAAVQAAEMERLRSLISDASSGDVRHSVSASLTGDAIQREVDDATRQAVEREVPRFFVTAAQDAEYLAAANAGDEATAQRMVDETAKRAGYTIKAFHSTAKKFYSFDKSKANDSLGRKMGLGLGKGKFYFLAGESYGVPNPSRPIVMDSYLKITNPISQKDYESRVAEVAGVENFIDIPSGRGRDNAIAKVDKQLDSEGVDGIIDSYERQGRPDVYGQIAVFSPEQIKSSAPVTRNKSGNVIPLSERFNEKSDDIRFSVTAARRYAEKTGVPAEGEQLVESQLELLFGTDIEKKHGMSKAQRKRVLGMRSAYSNALKNSADPSAWENAFNASKDGTVSRVIHDFFAEKDTPNYPEYKGQSDEFLLLQNGRSILGLKVETPQDFAALLMPLRNPYCESMKAIYLDEDSRVIDARVFSIGILDTAIFHPREAFKPAVKMNAKKVVFAHNHPSGDPSPSDEDYKVTKKMQASADFLGIELLDNIITNGNSFHSFKHGDFNYNGILPDWEAVAAGRTATVNTAEKTAQLANTLRQGQGDFIHAIMLDDKMGITAVSRIPFDPSQINDRISIRKYIAPAVSRAAVQNPTKYISLDLTASVINPDLATEIHRMVDSELRNISINIVDSIYEKDGWAYSVFRGGSNKLIPLTPKAAEMSAVAESNQNIADTVEQSLFSGIQDARYSVSTAMLQNEVDKAKKLEAKREIVASWIVAHPDEYEAMKQQKSNVLKAAGYTRTGYHGTDSYKRFTVFKAGVRGYLGPGIYLTEKKQYAEKYANKNGLDGKLYEVAIRMANPLRVSNLSDPGIEILEAGYGSRGKKMYESRENKQSNSVFILKKADIEKLKDKGYDGIVWGNESSKGEEEYMVFESSQVKSTDPLELDDSGKFVDSSKWGRRFTDDIRFSVSGRPIDDSGAEGYNHRPMNDFKKQDAEYLAAVERGDEATAQKMVDEAAKKAGILNYRDRINNLIDEEKHLRSMAVSIEEKQRELAGKDSQGRYQTHLYDKVQKERMSLLYNKASSISSEIQTVLQEVEDSIYDTKKFTEFVNESKAIIVRGEFDFYGIRAMRNRPKSRKNIFVKVGKTLPPSYYQPDGVNTGEVLYGASALNVKESNLNDVLNSIKMYVTNGLQIVLIGSDSVKGGNDIGEIEMANAKVLAQFIVQHPLDVVVRDDSGNVIPLSERFNPKSDDIRYSVTSDKPKESRNSFSAWFHPYDENSRINNRILVADVIATDAVKGIKRDEAEYENLAKSRRVDLAEARKDAEKVLTTIKGKRPTLDDIHAAMTANRAEDLYRVAMDNAAQGAADAATIAQKGLMDAQKRSIEDAPDIDLLDFIAETKIDPARDLTAIAPELFDPDYKPEQKKEEPEGDGDGERAEPTEEQLRDAEEANAKRDSTYRKILDMLQAWRESQEVEKAKREREDTKSKGAGEAGEKSEESEEVEELPWIPPAVEGENVGVRTASEFAHLLRLGVERWIESRTRSANAAEMWKNPANVETLRKSMQGMLRDIARKWIDPNAAKAYNAVLRSISEIPASVDPDGIELRASRIVGMIQRHAVRLSRKQLMKDLGTDIRELAIKGKTLDALEREQNRKVKGEHEAGARFLLKVLEWSDARCDRELQLRTDWLESRTRGYDDDDDSRNLEPASDQQIHRWQEEMNVIERWGKLKYKMPAEIVRAGDEVRTWLNGARAEHEARFAEVVARRNHISKAIMNAAMLDPSTPKPDWGFGRKFADELTSTLRQRLEAIMLPGGKKVTDKERREAQNAIDDVLDIVAQGSEKYRTLMTQYGNETQKCIENAIKGTGMTYRQFIKLLDKKIPAALNAQISDEIMQGMHASMTWGNAAQLYAELRQTQSYARNIVENNRQGQAEAIRKEMPVQILRFISGMREVYQHRRGELSEVQERTTGFPVRNPDPLYMPAKMFLEPHGELDIEVNAWRPIPKAFSPRVANKRDFDESAHIMSVSHSAMRNTALAIAFAESGLDLRSILARKDTYSAIERYHGKEAAKQLIQQVTDHLTAGYRQGKTSATDRAVQVASTLHTYSALSWNATSGLKQAASMPAWVPLLEGGYRELWGHLMTGLHDKAAVQELMASPGFIARYGAKSMADMFREAWTDPSKTVVTRFYRAGMSAIQLGDFLASKAVAVGVYKAKRDDLVSRGMPMAQARERAARDAWALVEEAQQSDRPENTPDFLRRHGFFAKQIYKFASSQMLQTSHEVHAFMQWKDSGFKDSKQRKRFVNTVIANHMMLPVAFTIIEQCVGLVLGGVPEDEEKWRKDVIANLLLEMTAGPYGRIVFVGSIARKLTGAALGAIGFKPRIYDAGALPSVEMVERLANRGAVTMSDIADADWDSARDDMLKMLGQLNVPIRYADKAWSRWVDDEKRK